MTKINNKKICFTYEETRNLWCSVETYKDEMWNNYIKLKSNYFKEKYIQLDNISLRLSNFLIKCEKEMGLK